MSGGPQASVGGYRLTGLIGRGSIGEVHRAVDPVGGGQVALKIVRLGEFAHDASGRADIRRLFIAEAEAAQRLVHPNIVRVHGAGEDAGVAWLAMELLGGCDLLRYTRPARLLPEPVVFDVGERVAHALAYAHGAGVVHRDVKPANVMVDWSAGRVTLTDFGVARLADAERTSTGVVLGTPVYMAPEQLAGAAADASGDLYALGVVLFEMLAGRLPHEGTSMGDLLRQVAAQPAPDLRELRPELPAGCAELVAALLAKRPGERPRGADVVADALRRLRAAWPGPG